MTGPVAWWTALPRSQSGTARARATEEARTASGRPHHESGSGELYIVRKVATLHLSILLQSLVFAFFVITRTCTRTIASPAIGHGACGARRGSVHRGSGSGARGRS